MTRNMQMLSLIHISGCDTASETVYGNHKGNGRCSGKSYNCLLYTSLGTVYNDKEGQAREMLNLAFVIATDGDKSDIPLIDGKYVRTPYHLSLIHIYYVPAAAVIRRGQALSGFTGCKGSVDGVASLM